jgi:hypothetical protein
MATAGEAEALRPTMTIPNAAEKARSFPIARFPCLGID